MNQTETHPSVPPDRPPEPAARLDQQIWAAGDYCRIGSRLQPVGESLCDAVDVRGGETVLDVAAGNGNAALAAARCNADVLATDFVPGLLEGAARRAAADGLLLRTQLADAEDLPFADGCFDVALSTFGVMFTPGQERAARELVRVVRPGGRIGLANWTPQGFLGELFAVIRRHVPAPPGASSPMRWGDERVLRELLGDAVEVRTARRVFTFRYRSPQHMLDEFRDWYGPMLQAFAALPSEGRESLAAELLALFGAKNRRLDGALAIPAEYLEVVAVRRAR